MTSPANQDNRDRALTRPASAAKCAGGHVANANISNNGVPDNPVSYSSHPAWITRTTNPVQRWPNVLGYTETYSGQEVYSKARLASDLANEYLWTDKAYRGIPLVC